MQKLILPLLLASTAALAGCSSPAPSTGPSVSTPTPIDMASTPAAGTLACDYPASGQASKQVNPPGSSAATTGTVDYLIDFNSDPVRVTLDREKAPCTVNSFVSLAEQGYFDDTSCHRLVDSSGLYVLQCGDPTGSGSGGPGYSFADELDGTETYPAGTLAMANAGADTNGSQFFIVYADSQLNPAYTVFGKLDAAGIKTVTEIASAGQDGSYPDGSGKPKGSALIESVKPA